MSYRNKNVIYRNILTEEDGNEYEETVIEEECDIEKSMILIKNEVRERNSSYGNKSEYEDGEIISETKSPEAVFTGIKEEWSAEGEASKTMDSLESDDERTEFYIERTNEGDEEDDGEETIAMFVTASGQQLALYAVEDSDDYFAVAVYDESGEPPSNFQFLMKSDVERLIREGAVKTVKKPTQIKKQLVAAQPPVLVPKEEIVAEVIPAVSQVELTTEKTVNNCHFDNKKTKAITNYVRPKVEAPKIIRLDDSGSEEELVEQSTVQYILCDGDQSDAELTFDEIQASLQGMKTNIVKKHHKNISIEKPPDKIINNGLLYITTPIRNTGYRGGLYTNPVKVEPPPKPQVPVKRSHISYTSIIGSKQNHGLKRELSPMSDYYTPNTSSNFSFSESLIKTNSQSKVKRPRKQQLTTVNRGDSEIIIQPASMLEEEEEIPIPRKKGRRKKKYEKVSKLPTRKSTRRRRTRVEIIDIDIDDDDSDEPLSRQEILEITIDENKEKGSSDKENEVIMVGDSDDDDEDDEDEEDEEDESLKSLKCKHCSKIFKQRRGFETHSRVCTKLKRRSTRFSERLSRDDSESETDSESSKDNKIGKRRNSKDKNSKPKKEYTCKTCEEKFDMVVTLARHVRAEHSPRKRGRPSKADSKKMKDKAEEIRLKVQKNRNAEKKYKQKRVQDEDETTTEEETDEETNSKIQDESDKDYILEEKGSLTSENETKKNNKSPLTKTTKIDSPSKGTKLQNKHKFISNLHRKWKFAEVICTICNRWLPSASAYENHSLHHFTKRCNEKTFKRRYIQCPICNKIFKSTFTYLKHKGTHAKVVKSIKSEEGETWKETQAKEMETQVQEKKSQDAEEVAQSEIKVTQEEKQETQGEEEKETQSEEKKETLSEDKKETQSEEKKETQSEEKNETQSEEKKETQNEEKKETQSEEKKETRSEEKKETQSEEKKETQSEEKNEAQSEEKETNKASQIRCSKTPEKLE